jgi:hypothetical protein
MLLDVQCCGETVLPKSIEEALLIQRDVRRKKCSIENIDETSRFAAAFFLSVAWST